MKRSILASAVIFTLAGAAFGATVRARAVRHPAPVRPDVRGVYVYAGLETPFSSSSAQPILTALRLPGVDGILLVGLWSTIEPSMGQYDWSSLDAWTGFASSSGKKLTLSIRTGNGTPSWLFQAPPAGAGATPLTFTVTPHEGKTNVCITEVIAAPWDAAFQTQWDAMLGALSAHLKSSGGYATLTTLRLTGINRTSDELRLPAETAQSTGLSCVSDSIAMWQQAGYRPSKLLQGWTGVVQSFQRHFPEKAFSVAIISNPPQIPFPTIDETGAVMTGTIPDQNPPLLQFAAQTLPAHLVVQFNFLMPGQPANPFVISAAQTLGTMAAFQTNNFYSLTDQGAACGGTPDNPTPCTAAEYMTMLETGIYPLGQANPLRAQYLEVWHANATAFPQDIEQAHVELLATPP